MKPEWIEARSRYEHTLNIVWAHRIRGAEVKASFMYGITGFCIFILLTNFLMPLPTAVNGWVSLVGAITFVVGRYWVITARETRPLIRKLYR